MIKIFIIEDKFAFGLEDVLKHLTVKNLKFEITIFSTTLSAMRHLRINLDKIDLVIFNFGNNRDKEQYVKTNTEEFDVISEIERVARMMNNKKLLIIINSLRKLKLSDTMTEKEYFSKLKSRCGITIEHVEELEGSYLYEFIEKNMPEKIEFQ